MLSAITSVTFFQQILIRDVLDIAVIAILIYTCIRLLRETHSTPVFAGVITIIALYILSKSLGLPITESVLRTFLSTFLVVLAVVFQKELRRFFSFFGFFKIGKIPTPPNDEVMQTVSSTVFELIQRKLGALIVFPGHESIARVVEGGYELGGEVSEPILLSIFDETSPGHDGAVVIQNNIIATFGVHLPLADQIEKVRQFGLRHRAALGLSERSDAMVIVVSQEKGKVSVAYRGAIRHVAGEQELIEILTSFYREKFPRSDMAHIMRWVGKNASLILVSIILSVVVWVAVRINGI